MGRPRLLAATVLAGALCLEGLMAAPACAAPLKADIRGLDNRALRQEIENAIGVAAPPASRLEARRRASEAADQATAVLRSEGYYDATVEPDIGDGDTPRPFVTVTLGAPTRISEPVIDWAGGPPSKEAQAAVVKVLGLKTGDPARAVDVIAAEGRIVAALENQGYADAAAQPREVVVDHADRSMHPLFHIAAGSVVRLGAVQMKTLGRTKLRWLARLTPWKVGQAYRPALVADMERRLLDTGAYDSVAVTLAPAGEGGNGLRPVIVTVADRPKGVVELGASYSTTEGVGVDSRWMLYNLLGRGDTLANTVQLAQIDSRIQSEVSLPNWRAAQQTLKLTGAIYRDNTPAYNEIGAGVAADVTQRYKKTSFLSYGVSFDETETTEKEAADFVTVDRLRLLSTFALLGAFSLDASNDILDPTRGVRLSGRLEPKMSIGDGSITYLKTSLQGAAYWPILGDANVLAARVRVGSILGGAIPRVPAQDRFYAGGGGSVRGFGYQAVGPRYPDNTPRGGLSLFETSLELRRALTQHWGVAAFVDAGSVGEFTAPNFRAPQVGAGLGVRYNLGFGPIRVDFATPVTRRRGDAILQVYLSIGQSF